jgi:hypothetical protein
MYRREKSELAGISLSQESIKKNWDGVVQNIAKNESATTIRQKMDCYKKSI